MLRYLPDSKPKLPEYLLRRVREFRKHPTTAEAMLWECLRGRRLNGTKFRRQHPIRRYVVDFYCHEHKLIVELDGEIHEHQREYDAVREADLILL
jgi:type I restriction enzyme R subunit